MPSRQSVPAGAPCWLDLATSDPPRSRDFYAGLFGWTYEAATDEVGGYMMIVAGGERIAGVVGNRAGSGFPDGWTTYLASHDAEATARAAAAAGGTVVRPALDLPGMGAVAILRDPAGALVGVWQPSGLKGFLVFGEVGTPGWHELATPHYDEAIAFYSATFGWQTRLGEGNIAGRYALATFDGMPLAGVMDTGPSVLQGEPARWHVYFVVEDVDATLAETVARGGTIFTRARDSPDGMLATASDPTGAIFKIIAPPR